MSTCIDQRITMYTYFMLGLSSGLQSPVIAETTCTDICRRNAECNENKCVNETVILVLTSGQIYMKRKLRISKPSLSLWVLSSYTYIAVYFLPVGCFLSSFFGAKYGGRTFLQDVDKLLPEYSASRPTKNSH
jgi:hypothetical protein